MAQYIDPTMDPSMTGLAGQVSAASGTTGGVDPSTGQAVASNTGVGMGAPGTVNGKPISPIVSTYTTGQKDMAYNPLMNQS